MYGKLNPISAYEVLITKDQLEKLIEYLPFESNVDYADQNNGNEFTHCITNKEAIDSLLESDCDDLDEDFKTLLKVITNYEASNMLVRFFV